MDFQENPPPKKRHYGHKAKKQEKQDRQSPLSQEETKGSESGMEDRAGNNSGCGNVSRIPEVSYVFARG